MSNPIMIVGLPGVGNIGNLVAQYLRNELKAKRFATLYSPYFPYQIIIKKEGNFRLVSNRFYHCKNQKGNDIVILLGDYQSAAPEGQYEVNERIVEFFKFLGGKMIYTIGGYSTSNQYVPNPKVFGVATDRQIAGKLRKAGVIFEGTEGMSVLGTAGMVVAFSKKHKMPAACIMGETGFLDVDANSARSVLKVLMTLTGISVSLTNIDKLQKDTAKLIKDLEDAAKAAQQTQSVPQEPQVKKSDLTYIR